MHKSLDLTGSFWGFDSRKRFSGDENRHLRNRSLRPPMALASQLPARRQKTGPPAHRPPRSPQRHPLSGQDRRSMAAPAQKLPALADRLSPLPPVEPERPAGPAQPPPPRQGAAGGRQTRATLRRQPRQSDRARQRPRRPSRLRCRQENQGPQAFPARGHAGIAVGRHGGTRRLPRTKRCPHLAGGRLGRLSGTAQTVGGRRLQRPRVRRLGADATSHLDRGSRETSRRGARVYPPAQTLGRRTHLRLVDALPSPGARARANRGFRHRLDLPRHDPPHAPPTRMNITPFCLFRRRLRARLRIKFGQSSSSSFSSSKSLEKSEDEDEDDDEEEPVSAAFSDRLQAPNSGENPGT